MIENFTNLLKKHENFEFHIFIAQVDPDAIGAAFGIAYLIKHYGLDSKIFYAGDLAHPQNRCISNRYDLSQEMIPISLYDSLALDKKAAHVLVDSNRKNDARFPDSLTLNPIIVIDHHRDPDLSESEEDTFFLIDPSVGSACTLITEMIRELNLDISQDVRLNILLALGIYTDTSSLIGSGDRDNKAWVALKANISNRELAPLIEYALPESHYTNLTTALSKIKRKGSRILAEVGTISPKKGDDLSTIADYLLRMDGISLVLVYGIIRGKDCDQVRISSRNKDLATPLNEFMSSRFGDKGGAKQTPDGRGEGGATITLDVGFWQGPETEESVAKMVREKLEHLTFSTD